MAAAVGDDRGGRGGRTAGQGAHADQCRQSDGVVGLAGVRGGRARRPGWETQRWSESVEVEVTTLDALIARHGVPAFIKLDVEGFEAEALSGLSQAVRALSFEFTTIQRDVALACIERCAAMGYARFNAALGESQTLVGEWVGREGDRPLAERAAAGRQFR